MIAALPMYDRPEVAAANDRLWAAIRDWLRGGGIEAPEALTRQTPDLMRLWLDPELLLAQTCGLPYRARLHGRVTLVGTPDYGVEGCAPGYYRSVLVVRAEDRREGIGQLAGAPMAFNDALSHSGWAAPLAEADAAGLRLHPALRTGSHRASAQAVAEGRADWAAIDAVSWRLIARHDTWAEGLRVAGHTAAAPGLPFITARPELRPTLEAGCRDAVAALCGDDRDALGLCGFVAVPAPAYLALPVPPHP